MAGSIWWRLLSIVTVASLSDALISNACYGTDPVCDFYSMTCTEGQIINLNNLYAGYKTAPQCVDGTSHCTNFDFCCKITNDNTTEVTAELNLENTYNTYTNCSGRPLCLKQHAPWQLIDRYESKTSTFVHYEYECEQNSLNAGKIQMCGGPTGVASGDFTETDIIFDGSKEAFNRERASKECQCKIVNKGTLPLIFTTIDVRMESYYKAQDQQSADCSSALFTSSVFVSQCAPSTKHHLHNFYYNGEQLSMAVPQGGSTEINLTNLYRKGSWDSPSMIWVKVRALQGSTFNIECKEVLPADLTTTSTTTTTTPTTTTTTPTTTTKTTTTPTTTTTTPTTTTKPPITTKRPTTTTTTPTTTTKPPITTKRPTTTTTTTTTTPTTTTKPPITTKRPTTTTTTPTTTTKPPITTKRPTTTTTTPKTTTTTPKTTTTTPKTTTTTPTTKRRTTTTTIPPTTTTTKTTTRPTTPRTTQRTVRTTQATSAAGGLIKSGDGQKDDKQRTEVYIAIFVPIAVGLLIIVIFLLWVYWKRTTPHKEKFNLRKYHPGHDPYRVFSDDKILDKYIRQQGIKSNSPSVLSSSVKPPINTHSVVSVPSIRPSMKAEEYEKKITEKYVPINGSTYSASRFPIQPYTIPIHVTKHNPLYDVATGKSVKQQPSTVYHVKMGSPPSYSASGPQPIRSDPPGVTYQTGKNYNDNLKNTTVNQVEKSAPKTEDETSTSKAGNISQNEGVVIHVDNLSLPPSSARTHKSSSSSSASSSSSSSSPSTSNQSLDGSTTRSVSPVEDQPALISTEPVDDNASGSEVMQPETFPDDDTDLIVRF